MKTPHFFKKCGAHAKAQNRTADTLIFSQVLYHLSYLGDLGIISARTGLSRIFYHQKKLSSLVSFKSLISLTILTILTLFTILTFPLQT